MLKAVNHYLLLAALALTALTYWAPWIDHDAAALKLSGQDIGEFYKFLPAFGQSSERDLEHKPPMTPLPPRQLFYVPPLVCAFCLTLVAANQQLAYPQWARMIVLVCALMLLPGLLPPVWGHPKELFAGEFRAQGYGLVFGTMVILGHGLFRKIPLPLLGVTVSVLALVALITAQGSFWLARARLWAAYNTPTAALGWGLWLHTAAWVVTIALAAQVYRTQSVHRMESIRRMQPIRPTDSGPRIKENGDAR